MPLSGNMLNASQHVGRTISTVFDRATHMCEAMHMARKCGICQMGARLFANQHPYSLHHHHPPACLAQ